MLAVVQKAAGGKPKHEVPEKLLDYLARYTHRTALSNHRITAVHQGQVTLTYRERNNTGSLLPVHIPVEEFIRRFLLHILPCGFVRIRHFGLRANRNKHLLEKARELLGLPARSPSCQQKIRPRVHAATHRCRHHSLPPM